MCRICLTEQAISRLSGITMEFQSVIFSSLLLILIVDQQGVHSSITIPPSNVAAVAGTSVIFNCNTNNSFQSIIWAVQYNSGPQILISSNCNNFLGNFATRCEIITDTLNQCNLKFLNVTEQDVGIYSCIDTGSASETVCAYLAVFASNASCFTDSSTYAFEDETVSLSCNASGASYLSAAMSMNVQWSGAGCPNVITPGNGTFVSSSVSITAKPPTVPSCNSTTYFTASNPNPNACQLVATNAPTYSYTWFSPLTNVSYCPKVSLNYADSAYEGDVVICSAYAFPPVQMVNLTVWMNTSSEEFANSTIVFYPLLSSGTYIINCTAINYPYKDGNESCSNSTVITLSVLQRQCEDCDCCCCEPSCYVSITIGVIIGLALLILLCVCCCKPGCPWYHCCKKPQKDECSKKPQKEVWCAWCSCGFCGCCHRCCGGTTENRQPPIENGNVDDPNRENLNDPPNLANRQDHYRPEPEPPVIIQQVPAPHENYPHYEMNNYNQADNAAAGVYAEIAQPNHAARPNDEQIAIVNNRPGSRQPVQYPDTVDPNATYADVKRA